MALLIKVNKETVNYETYFKYTIDANFVTYGQTVENAEIRIFFPTNILYYLGDYESPIEGVTETTTDLGTDVVFSIGALANSGTSLRVAIGAAFSTAAVNGESFAGTVTMYINGEEVDSSTAGEVSLFATANFDINRTVILPETQPASGGAVFYRLYFENMGDLGVTAKNVTITIVGEDRFTIDPEFEVIGKDVSTGSFVDTGSDGLIGTVTDNMLTFTISEYNGERYEFIYRTVLADNLAIGTEIDTLATVDIDGTIKNDILPITLATPSYIGSTTVFSPTYTIPQENIGFELTVGNSGNQVLTNVVVKTTFSQDVSYYEIVTGNFYYQAIDLLVDETYYIDYTTALKVTGRLGPFNTSVSEKVVLSDYIADGDNLSTLTWNFETFGVGVKTQTVIQINGIVNEGTTGESFMTSTSMAWDGGYTTSNDNTEVSDFCVLTPVFYSNTSNYPVRVGEEITFTLGGNFKYSRINNPIFAMYLDSRLEYVEGTAVLNYDNYFIPTKEPTLPEAVVIEDFIGDGRTLVKFEFKGEYAFDFMQKTVATISFNARVKEYSSGTFTSQMYLNVLDRNGIIEDGTDIYYDENNIAQDTSVKAEYASSSIISNEILIFVGASSQIFVKGQLDDNYSSEGTTYAGGKAQYKIVVENTGNTVFNSIEIVDIIPYINDTNILNPDISRNSKFRLYDVSEPAVQISPTSEIPNCEIYYSESTDPVRFNYLGEVIGTVDDWTTNFPNNSTLIRAIKVVAKDINLVAQESLEISLMTSTRPGLNIGIYSYHTFAANITYTNMSDEQENLLPIEPESAALMIAEAPTDKGVISGSVFFDETKDGIYDIKTEYGVDQVGVVVYDSNNEMVDYAITCTDASGNAGSYYFANLDVEDYTVKYLLPDSTMLTKQVLDEEYGSMPDPYTNETPVLTLSEELIKTVYAGLVKRSAQDLDTILEVNRSARSMVRNVIYNQMLIGMKNEDVLELIKETEN